jgi:hypothetical protein
VGCSGAMPVVYEPRDSAQLHAQIVNCVRRVANSVEGLVIYTRTRVDGMTAAGLALQSSQAMLRRPRVSANGVRRQRSTRLDNVESRAGADGAAVT